MLEHFEDEINIYGNKVEKTIWNTEDGFTGKCAMYEDPEKRIREIYIVDENGIDFIGVENLDDPADFKAIDIAMNKLRGF